MRTRFSYDDAGQMAVEMVVALPVAIVLLLITINLMFFMSECARFDNLAAYAVVDAGCRYPASSTSDDLSAQIRSQVIESMGSASRCDIIVRRVGSSMGEGLFSTPVEYECTMNYRPWPSLGSSVAVGHVRSGSLSMLSRTRSVSIDPFRAGALF